MALFGVRSRVFKLRSALVRARLGAKFVGAALVSAVLLGMVFGATAQADSLPSVEMQAATATPTPTPTGLTASVEEVLEKGLRLAEASPVHLAVRGTGVNNSTRCDWRGIARTLAQREAAIRFWLGLAATDTLPSASFLEILFTVTLDTLNPEYKETAKSNFLAIARGGLSPEYLFLTCYVDYTASEYLLGTGPTTLTLAYDRMGEAHSYELYQREHAAGQFGDEALMSESAYQAQLDQIVWDAELSLSALMEGQESVVFLAPLGAHNAIAVEAWQVVAQWDVETVDGTVNVIRHGTYPGDPEHTQTLANLSSRITTAAASDAFADNRIANASGLQAYYTTIGAYGDITPDDGETTTFTPAQPPPMRLCANGTAVPNPADNRLLVQDCEVLLAVKDTLAGAATLNWAATTAITGWEGVTTGGTPSRVTALVLTNKSLTGTIPPELARLTSLGELKLSGNLLTGCIPLVLRQIGDNDFASLNLSYCGDPPPMPENLSVTLSESTFSITWDAVPNADQYAVQYRTGPESDWVSIDPPTADASTTFTLASGLVCGTFEFQFRVRARGDGITLIPDWSAWTSESDAISVSDSSALARDCGTLLSVKDTLAGTGTLNWSVDVAIANWDGVTVGGTPSRITRLDISFMGLTGSLPPQLSSLDRLQVLFAGYNQLTGSIPRELGNLTTLTTLWVNNNRLTGSIPRELGNLTNLTTFGVNNNQLSGPIPLELGKLSLLFELKLAGNSLTGCLPLALQNVRYNDFDTLGLSVCGTPPAPEGLRMSLTGDTFLIMWDAETGAARYEVQYRTGPENSWSTLPTTEETSTTFTLAPDAVCETAYTFQVRAYGDGRVYEADWGAAAESAFLCNQSPAFGAESYSFSVFEDAASGEAVGTVSATDPDTDDTVTYAITEGNEDGKFTIDDATGAITVAGALDHETTPSYLLTVAASDGNDGTATVSVTVTVTDVPENLPPAPEGLNATLADGVFSLSWNAVPGVDEYEVQYRTSAEEAWVALPAVTDTSTTFTPVGGTVCGTTYAFQVRSHGDGEDYVAAWGTAYTAASLTTDACNQPPAFDAASYSFSVFEDAASGETVGTVSATDPDTDDTVTYAITGGNADGKFAIDDATGAITVAGALDHETTPSYVLTVAASDGNEGTATVSVSITVTSVLPEDLPPAPENLSATLTDGVFSLSWNAVSGADEYEAQYRASAEEAWVDVADADSADTRATFTPAGGTVCGTTYQFQVRSHGDGEDYVAAWGTAYAAASLTTDACNQPPAFDAASYSFSVFENAAINEAVGTVSATDPDTDDTVTYAITEGNADGKFAIDATGTITVAGALDHETTPSYLLTVAASDENDGTATADVTVTVTSVLPEDLPPAPENLSATLTDGVFSLSWNAVSGADEYEVQYRASAEEAWVDVADADSADTRATFTPAGGTVCGTTYQFQVRSHGDGEDYVAAWGTAYAAASLTTDACNQPPAFDAASYSFSVFENAAINEAVGTVSATDPDTDDTVTYAITEGNADGKFAIDATGTITVAGALDHETTASYPLTVAASDENDGTATADVTVTVTSVLPEDLPPAPEGLSASLTDGVFSLSWNAVSGADEYEVQYRASAEEAWVALPAVTDTRATFTPAGGTVCGTTYQFQVRSHGDGEDYVAAWGEVWSDAASVTTDACNQPPAFDAASYSFSVFEDAASTEAVGAVSATDPDTDDTVTYAITEGNADGKFAIDAATGAITVAGALDHETTPSYLLTVAASDGNEGTATVSVTVTVTPADML